MSLIEKIHVSVIVGLISLILYLEIRSLILCWLRKRPPFPRGFWFLHLAFCMVVGGLAYAFFVEPYWLEVREIKISTDKLERAEFTIVLISDLHCDLQRRNEEAVVDKVNALGADIVVFTGDSINTPAALPAFRDTLRRLQAKLGKVAVKGNWDIWYWRGLDVFHDTGFRQLQGESQVFEKDGEKLLIAGADPDQNIKREGWAGQLSADMYNVFLFHYPWVVEHPVALPFDLFLSGHIHGGQVALPFYGAVVTMSPYGKKYESGMYKLLGKKLLYISRGVGMEGGTAPRLRFWSRPEITVFHLKPVRSKANERL